MASEIPADIDHILKGLAAWAEGYSTGLKWNEVAKLKADLMANRRYWLGVPVAAIRVRLRELGMSDADASTVCDLVSRAQAGRRLVPHWSYRSFTFDHSDAPERPIPRPSTSVDW
ncbi:hypothetical protein M3F59_12740 [Brachybacterium muris]|uniref:hypothetical protein n=1 Tax=Brachybacterium muris TaxID=219301 RepID=UPI00223AF554|nr:hypothetical protein [Brachybacterium muris]MCT2262470.1 hypothetical protein [Brachybacterium muris]